MVRVNIYSKLNYDLSTVLSILHKHSLLFPVKYKRIDAIMISVIDDEAEASYTNSQNWYMLGSQCNLSLAKFSPSLPFFQLHLSYKPPRHKESPLPYMHSHKYTHI